MKNEGVRPVFLGGWGGRNVMKRGGKKGLKHHTFFNTGLRNKVEIYFHVKSGASRMKNEGVMTVLVGETTMIKRGG